MDFLIVESRIIGHANKTLLPEMATRLGLAIGTYFGKRSILATARDFRNDSRMIKRALSGGLMSTGIDVLDLHAAATSTLQFIVKRFGASGGLSFTGSHYIDGEISVRILEDTGNEIEEHKLLKIINIAKSGQFQYVSFEELGSHSSIENSIQIYQTAIQNFVKKELIQKANFRIILDCSLGPTALRVPHIFTELNIDIITMNAHQISTKSVLPNPKSIHRISKSITAINADLGIIIDTEGIKTIVLDNNGIIIPPEDLMAYLIWLKLKERNGPIILSKLFTKRFDEAFETLNARIIRIDDKPGNIGRQITLERAVIGATDNGKLHNPVWGAETDGTLSALTLLQNLASSNTKLSEDMKLFEAKKCRSELVSQIISKITLPDKISQLQFFRRLQSNNEIYRNKTITGVRRDTLVGIKLEIMNGFFHFMISQLENEINIIIETSQPQNLANMVDLSQEIAKEIINSIVQSP